MASLFKGLDAFGMDDLDQDELFAEKSTNQPKDNEPEKASVNEEDLIYDRSVRCPVCDKVIEVKTVKQGLTKQTSTDLNLRPVYNHVDLLKYDVVLCKICGFSALNRNYKKVTDRQIKIIREKISCKFVGKTYPKVYDYEIALERYKMVLYNDVVMGRNDVDKAFVCLRISWIIESLLAETYDEKEKLELEKMYQTYVANAFKGFNKSYKDHIFPVYGMNPPTYEYLLGVLAYEIGETAVATNWVDKVIASPVSSSVVKMKAKKLKSLLEGA